MDFRVSWLFVGLSTALSSSLAPGYAETHFISYSPLLVVETQPHHRNMILVVGGFNDTPAIYEPMLQGYSLLGFDSAFLAQRTESGEFTGPIKLLPEDLNRALITIRRRFSKGQILILGHSMAWGTIESWRQNPRFRATQKTLGNIQIIESSPATDIDDFVLKSELDLLDQIPSGTHVPMFLKIGRSGHLHRRLIGGRNAELVRNFRKWLLQVREAPLNNPVPMTTTVVASTDDPNVKLRFVESYLDRLKREGTNASLRLVNVQNARHDHSLWTAPELTTADVLSDLIQRSSTAKSLIVVNRLCKKAVMHMGLNIRGRFKPQRPANINQP